MSCLAQWPGRETRAQWLLAFIPITVAIETLCSYSALLGAAPKVAKHFVSVEVRAFGTGDRAAALVWIEAGP